MTSSGGSENVTLARTVVQPAPSKHFEKFSVMEHVLRRRGLAISTPGTQGIVSLSQSRGDAASTEHPNHIAPIRRSPSPSLPVTGKHRIPRSQEDEPAPKRGRHAETPKIDLTHYFKVSRRSRRKVLPPSLHPFKPVDQVASGRTSPQLAEPQAPSPPLVYTLIQFPTLLADGSADPGMVPVSADEIAPVDIQDSPSFHGSPSSSKLVPPICPPLETPTSQLPIHGHLDRKAGRIKQYKSRRRQAEEAAAAPRRKHAMVLAERRSLPQGSSHANLPQACSQSFPLPVDAELGTVSEAEICKAPSGTVESCTGSYTSQLVDPSFDSSVQPSASGCLGREMVPVKKYARREVRLHRAEEAAVLPRRKHATVLAERRRLPQDPSHANSHQPHPWSPPLPPDGSVDAEIGVVSKEEIAKVDVPSGMAESHVPDGSVDAELGTISEEEISKVDIPCGTAESCTDSYTQLVDPSFDLSLQPPASGYLDQGTVPVKKYARREVRLRREEEAVVLQRRKHTTVLAERRRLPQDSLHANPPCMDPQSLSSLPTLPSTPQINPSTSSQAELSSPPSLSRRDEENDEGVVSSSQLCSIGTSGEDGLSPMCSHSPSPSPPRNHSDDREHSSPSSDSSSESEEGNKEEIDMSSEDGVDMEVEQSFFDGIYMDDLLEGSSSSQGKSDAITVAQTPRPTAGKGMAKDHSSHSQDPSSDDESDNENEEKYMEIDDDVNGGNMVDEGDDEENPFLQPLGGDLLVTSCVSISYMTC